MWINHSFFLECDFHFIICCIFNAHILMNYRRILLNMSNNNVLILAHFYTVLSFILWCVILLYKVEKYKNICHLQPNVRNALIDKQLHCCRYCGRYVADKVSATQYKPYINQVSMSAKVQLYALTSCFQAGNCRFRH